MSSPDATSPTAMTPPSLNVFQKGGKIYDLLAAAPLIVWFAISMGGSIQVMRGYVAGLLLHPDVPLCLMLLAKFAIFLFAAVAIAMLILRRPPQGSAQGLMPRVASILGTYLSLGLLMLPPAHLSALWLGISAFMTLGGMAFSCYSILRLGRSFSLMAEARQLVTDGPYSVLRHPLYVGEEIAIFGTAIQFFSPFAVWLVAMQIACQFYRMHCEEEVLANAFPEYVAYKARTARLIPGVY
jgi:protein-S-isoprenylcysteine O-methyltransferase Ste14